MHCNPHVGSHTLSLSLIMKTRNVRTGKACATSEGQSDSGQTDKPTEVVVSRIPFSDGKEVMVSQIIDKSLPDNKDDELEDSIPPSILGETSPEEKGLVIPSIEPKHLEKGKTDSPPTIIDRQEIVE